MAEWKKLVVSGSNISQLNNDAGYLTAGTITQANGYATASANGVELIAATATSSLAFASSSAQGLTIAASSPGGQNTLTFGLSAIPNASLANSSVTIGNTNIALGATATTINGLTLTNAVGSGSFSGSFQGDGSGLTGIASNLAISGSTGNGSVALKTQALSILGTANEVETSVSGQTVTIGLPNDVTIGNNLTVTGDLTVNGTTTTIHSANLSVDDRFILLSSGSTSANDGGIIIQSAAAGTGFAFLYDAGQARWGYTGSLAHNATSAAPDAFAAMVLDLQNGSTDIAAYQKNGNIKIDSGDIFIYA